MTKPQKPFPYLVVGISLLLGCMFLGFFYLAVTNEPEYMPSQKRAAVATTTQNNH